MTSAAYDAENGAGPAGFDVLGRGRVGDAVRVVAADDVGKPSFLGGEIEIGYGPIPLLEHDNKEAAADIADGVTDRVRRTPSGQ